MNKNQEKAIEELIQSMLLRKIKYQCEIENPTDKKLTEEVPKLIWECDHIISKLNHIASLSDTTEHDDISAISASQCQELVKDLADWSKKYPKGGIYSMSMKPKMDGELEQLERRAKQLMYPDSH